ncbi:hypothetical protein CBL_03449 [Carabus blaptoides fortunei]
MNPSVVLMLIAVCSGGPTVIPFPNIFQNVKQNEQIPFLKYHLMMGYSSSRPQNTMSIQAEPELPSELVTSIQQIPTPNNFDENLFQWTARTYGLSNDQVYHLARGQSVCLENGNCIDMGDVGSICCT